jgi:hypothetical protein
MVYIHLFTPAPMTSTLFDHYHKFYEHVEVLDQNSAISQPRFVSISDNSTTELYVHPRFYEQLLTPG